MDIAKQLAIIQYINVRLGYDFYLSGKGMSDGVRQRSNRSGIPDTKYPKPSKDSAVSLSFNELIMSQKIFHVSTIS